MSTKTTFKRVALVAVAALGLGVLSVAPSTAAVNADSLTVVNGTAAIGETTTARSASFTISFLAPATTDTMSVSASLISDPAGNSALPVMSLVETTAAVVEVTGRARYVSLASQENVNARDNSIPSGTKASIAPKEASVRATAKFSVYLGASGPAVAGTYVVRITPAATPAGSATYKDITIVVAAKNIKADSTSTAYIAAGAAIPNGADSASVTASKVAGSVAATILVTQLNADATATPGETLTVTIAGPGTLSAGSAATGQTATGARALGNVVATDKYIQVWSDGTSGAATVTITGNQSGLVFGTKTITFFDNKPATVTAVVKKAYPAAGKTTTSAVFVTVKDSAGNIVNGATVSLRPATTGTGETTTSCAYSATYSTNVCSVTGSSTAKFGKVSYKAHVVGVDTDETELDSAAFDVTFADTVATKVAITAPATAQVGEKIKVTLTATEKNGYPVADSTYEGAEAVSGIYWNTTAASVPSYSSATFKPFNTGETITTLSGVATQEIYVPATAGTLTSTWTLAGTAGANVTTGAIDKTIAGTTVTLKIAVASEALEAANAATTAALAANDAVDALAATVAKLVANLKAQITALTKLIVKIQKKVGA